MRWRLMDCHGPWAISISRYYLLQKMQRRFSEAFAASDLLEFAGFDVRIPCVKDLITNKKATGRPKDLIDVEVLERFALDEG